MNDIYEIYAFKGEEFDFYQNLPTITFDDAEQVDEYIEVAATMTVEEAFGDGWTYDDLFDCEEEIYDDEFKFKFNGAETEISNFTLGFEFDKGINVFIARKEYGAYQVCVNEDELSLDEIEIVKKFFDELVDKYGLKVVENPNAN
mgnify:CR=1 FL=1